MSGVVAPGADCWTLAVEALVNPVNCRGVMGAGLARQVAARYPEVLPEYVAACRTGTLRPGAVLIAPVPPRPRLSGGVSPLRWILHYPTKVDWRDPSTLALVTQGLPALDAALTQHQIRSLAIPALGCGLGGLAWADVGPLLEAFARASPVHITLIPPAVRAARSAARP